MKISFDKIETFGAGVTAYRIVPEREAEPAPTPEKPSHPIPRTDNARRLGDKLREQFQRPARAR